MGALPAMRLPAQPSSARLPSSLPVRVRRRQEGQQWDGLVERGRALHNGHQAPVQHGLPGRHYLRRQPVHETELATTTSIC